MCLGRHFLCKRGHPHVLFPILQNKLLLLFPTRICALYSLISFGNLAIHHPFYRFDGRRLPSGEAPPILPRHEKGIFPQSICTGRCSFSSHFLPAPRSYDTSPTVAKPHPYEGSHRSISRTFSTSPTSSKYPLPPSLRASFRPSPHSSSSSVG